MIFVAAAVCPAVGAAISALGAVRAAVGAGRDRRVVIVRGMVAVAHVRVGEPGEREEFERAALCVAKGVVDALQDDGASRVSARGGHASQDGDACECGTQRDAFRVVNGA